jgi:hypothetical protein
MSAAKPLCLLRSAADDRAEAEVYDEVDGALVLCSRGPAFDAALAEVQAREAAAVMAASRIFDRARARDAKSDVVSLARRTAITANACIAARTLSVSDSARLLDATRELVALALELAS